MQQTVAVRQILFLFWLFGFKRTLSLFELPLSRAGISSAQTPMDLSLPAAPNIAPFSEKRDGHVLFVNSGQKGNALLKHIHSVSWQFSNTISCDYEASRTTGILFLSLAYHRLHPEYLRHRINLLKSSYSSRIVLCQLDIVSNFVFSYLISMKNS